MERNVDESFADYKERRAASNLAVKQINAASKGGKGNPRDKRSKGTYGRALLAYFAQQNRTKEQKARAALGIA